VKPIPSSSRNAADLDVLDVDLVQRGTDGKRVRLLAEQRNRSSPLASVLRRRRSERELLPMRYDDLSTLLRRVLGPSYQMTAKDGYVETFRPFPSAGARHPHTLMLISTGVEGIPDGSWLLQPESMELLPFEQTEVIADLGSAISEAARVSKLPPATIVLLARHRRVLSKYPGDWGESLLWRDSGVLLATAHLVATDLGLGSSIVGIANSISIPIGEHEALVDTGALIVGRTGQGKGL
jgi:SagB-type dehydrogenase family enzyme